MTQPIDTLLQQLRTSAEADTRWRAAFALGLGTSAGAPRRSDVVGALAAALRDSDFGVRHNAAWALGQLAAHEVQDVLAAALTRPDETEEQVCMMAALALARLGGRYAVSVLQQAADAPTERVRRAAASALRARPWLATTP